MGCLFDWPCVTTWVSMGRQVRFDRFRFDPETGRLWAGAEEVRLTPKSAAVMSRLVAHAGEPVTKESLFASVWPDTAVSDDALTTCIAELRRALEDDAKQPRFIETRHRRGYRFAAALSPVEEVVAPTLDQPAAEAVPAPAPAAPAQPRQRRAKWILGAAAGALVALLLITRAPALWDSASARVPIRSLAVLPLANLTGDPAQEYFSDGMTEALITNLASLPALRVISRQSVMRYKGSTKPLPEIARELGVEGVVEGSVVRSGGRVRITAQLIHARTEGHLWARSYERRMEDVLALQGELARAIAEAVRVTVGTKEGRRLDVQRVVKPEAYDAYLLGRHHWNQRTEPSLERALSYFQAAIAADPDFALGHAGLALVHGPRQVYGYVPPGTGLAEQKAAALKALELDPGLAEPRAALGSARTIEWDWEGAEAEFRRAIELDPDSIVSHLWYGWHLRARGRLAEGEARRRRALELDPLNVPVNREVAREVNAAGDEEAALAQLNRALELEPDQASTHLEVALFHIERGRGDAGSRHLGRALAFEFQGPLPLASLAVVHAASGNAGEARRLLEKLRAESARRYVSPVLPAMIHAALAENDAAFALLDKACAAKDPGLITIQVGEIGHLLHLPRARLAALRADPRFGDLLRRMGLAPNPRPAS
jgi:TolB-like protein/DNA-binding winged helix-turn-helix (wHTH) protein/Flp pilus assembly protein TadD